MKKCLILITSILLIFLNSVFAQDLEITYPNFVSAYYKGEVVPLAITVLNLGNETASINLEKMFIGPDDLASLLTDDKEDILPNQKYTFDDQFIVEQDTTPGEHIFRVLIRKDNQLLEEKELTFTVVGTLQRFEEAKLLTCLDTSCNKPNAVFIKNKERVFVKLTNYREASLTAVLIKPDQSQENLFFQDGLVIISPQQSGDYQVQVTLSKDGFIPKDIFTSFSVLETAPVITKEQLCSINNICDSGETSQNCPQDCPLAAAPGEKPTWLYWLIGVLAVIILAVLIVIIIIKRKKPTPPKPYYYPSSQYPLNYR